MLYIVVMVIHGNPYLQVSEWDPFFFFFTFKCWAPLITLISGVCFLNEINTILSRLGWEVMSVYGNVSQLDLRNVKQGMKIIGTEIIGSTFSEMFTTQFRKICGNEVFVVLEFFRL